MKKKIDSEYLVLFGILTLAILFRIIRLRTAPDWFQDEGEFIRLADNISKGNFAFLGVRNSLLNIGRPPLFFWILAGAFKLFGLDIVVLRGFSVLCGLTTIGIAYLFVREALGKTPAIYTALLLAIMPEFVYYNRMGFTYNWTSLWMLFSLYSLWKYFKQYRQWWLVVSCLAAGIAFASDYIGIINILVIILVLIILHPKDLWKVPLVAIPILISVSPIFFIAPSDALHDLISTLSMTKGGVGVPGYQFARMLVVYPEMVVRQPFIVLGIVGLFIIPDKLMRGLILCLLSGIIILVSFSRALAAQHLLPVWPLAMIGLGFLLDEIVSYFYTNIKSSLVNINFSPTLKIGVRLRTFLGSVGTTSLVFCFVFLPISWMVITNVKGYMVEPADPSIVMTQVGWLEGYVSSDDAQAIAQEISKNVKSEDFVIAPGVVYWMLQSNAADPRTVVVYEHGGNILGVRDVNHDRFTVNSSLSNAKYAVVDNTWRYWLAPMAPEISTMLDKVKKWPMVMERGSLQLYCNPTFCQ